MKYKHIIFDFDGVLVESNEIRFNGFRKLFKDFPVDYVEQLVAFARANGGVSRYVKIKYFFKEILQKPISESFVHQLAAKYSDLVMQDVVHAKPVKGSLEFLEEFYRKLGFAVASGSDQAELRIICKKRKMDHFFEMVLGSPTDKKDNIATILSELNWKENCVLYVGDSKNDLDAAETSNIDFIGRCSGLVDWKTTQSRSLDDLSSLKRELF